MKFITISGLDGSGKSTQLKLLKNFLEEKNFSVEVFHAVEFSFANKISRFFHGEKIFRAGEARAIVRASKFTILLRKFFFIIDSFRFAHFQKSLEKKRKDFLISDRSLLDTAINILFLEKNNSAENFLKKFVPKADIAFYLHISPENITQRENSPEQGKKYLQEKFKIFEEKKKEWNLLEINGEQTPEKVFEEILFKNINFKFSSSSSQKYFLKLIEDEKYFKMNASKKIHDENFA